MNDSDASAAVEALASLVAPGGLLLITDKFASAGRPVREAAHVTRRPLPWYESIVAPYGPPACRYETRLLVHGQAVHRRAARSPSSGRGRLVWHPGGHQILAAQLHRPASAGGMAGGVGLAIDSAIVPRLAVTPNLTVAVFRRLEG